VATAIEVERTPPLAPTPVRCRPVTLATPPRLARALLAPMEAAAGVDAGDGGAGAAPPARRATQLRKMPRRSTPKPNPLRTSSMSRSMARRVSLPLLRSTKSTIATDPGIEDAAMEAEADSAAKASASTLLAIRTSGQTNPHNRVRAALALRAISTASTVARPAVPVPSPMRTRKPVPIPAPSRMILPGESLSKYRKGDDPAVQVAQPRNSATSVTLAPPGEPLHRSPQGWDGGAVLPGETLSRRRPSADSRNDSPRSFEREPRRFEGRGDRSETRRDNRSSFRNAPPVAAASRDS
jgi:hypothetical protein